MRHPGSGGLWIALAVGAAVAATVLLVRTMHDGEADEDAFDGVDEASADSFPASDAPSQTPVIGARTSGPRRR